MSKDYYENGDNKHYCNMLILKGLGTGNQRPCNNKIKAPHRYCHLHEKLGANDPKQYEREF